MNDNANARISFITQNGYNKVLIFCQRIYFQDSEGEVGSDSNTLAYHTKNQTLQHSIPANNRDSSKHLHDSLMSSNAQHYRRRRNLYSHHHYQRIRLKSAPPTGGCFNFHNFNHPESMVVSGIASTPTHARDNEAISKNGSDRLPKVCKIPFCLRVI